MNAAISTNRRGTRRPSRPRSTAGNAVVAPSSTAAHVPIAAFEALQTIDDLLGLISAEVGDPGAIDPVLSRLMLKAMREAEREPAGDGSRG